MAGTGTDRPARSATVVCATDDPRAAQVRAWLEGTGLAQAAWSAPRDLDHVERAVLDGQVRVVVFPGPADLMRSVWEEQTAAATWRTSGLDVRFVTVGSELAPETLADLLRAWEAARRRHRTARTVAGLLLGLLAVAAAFVLLWLTSRT